jgi:lysozyme family protein
MWAVDKSPLLPVVRAALNRTGFAVASDADAYYPGFAKQVAAFQKNRGLTVDGDLGPNTCRALRDAKAWPQLDQSIAVAAMTQALTLYNRAVLAYVVTQNKRIGEACRVFGRWVAAARAKARKNDRKLAAPRVQAAQVAWPVGSKQGSIRTSSAHTVGFAPLLAIPLIAGEAAVAAEITAAVGFVASAAAAAWAATRIGDALGKAETETNMPDVVSVPDVEAKVEPREGTPPGEKPPRFDFKDVKWRDLLKIGMAIAAGLGAVLISGLSVVAGLIPLAGAAAAVGIQVLIAAGGLLLIWLARKKRRGG